MLRVVLRKQALPEKYWVGDPGQLLLAAARTERAKLDAAIPVLTVLDQSVFP
jgi:hypothetical protein